ncbi:MAG: phosphoadenylyl-sulfate reductase [Terriglobales bacterium]
MNTSETTAAALMESALAAAQRPCITCSFQAEDMVVLDLARRVAPRIPVLFLDTGYHFAATYEYRDRMAARWELNLINLLPAQTTAAQEADCGLLYRSDPGRCCRLRKVEPLFQALETYDLWLTGLRREQSPTRRNLQTRETAALPSGRTLAKLNPLAEWPWREVWGYLERHGIEPLPLYALGYTSIGCQPCTTPPADPDDPRSGRWGGAKRECGIHLAPPAAGAERA